MDGRDDPTANDNYALQVSVRYAAIQRMLLADRRVREYAVVAEVARTY
jgi:hypothetical protein